MPGRVLELKAYRCRGVRSSRRQWLRIGLQVAIAGWLRYVAAVPRSHQHNHHFDLGDTAPRNLPAMHNNGPGGSHLQHSPLLKEAGHSASTCRPGLIGVKHLRANFERGRLRNRGNRPAVLDDASDEAFLWLGLRHREDQ